MALSLLSRNPFDDAYAARVGTLAGASRLAALRTTARAALSRGLPGPKQEEWRFTPLSALTRHGFIPAAAADDIDVQTVPLDVPVIPDAIRIVLVNGVYRSDLSETAAGIDVWPLSAAASNADILIGTVAPITLPMVALNTAFTVDGVLISATRDIIRPVHIISIGASGREPVAFHPRIIVHTAPGATVTIMETHVGLPGQPFLSNPVTEIAVAEDATVRRYVSVVEDGDAFHFGTTVLAVAARGTFEGFHLGLGGNRGEGTVRQEIHAHIEGADAKVMLGGAYAIGGTVHHDFTTVIEHHVGGSASKQLFKGVLDGRAHGVYQGRVTVAEDAQKTDARQLHKALFLTAGPALDVKPELEIAADDVQCAHGATTGSIDPDHLFFLAARGLDEVTARALLVEGFLADALEQISDEPVRAVFGRQVSAWLQRRGGEA